MVNVRWLWRGPYAVADARALLDERHRLPVVAAAAAVDLRSSRDPAEIEPRHTRSNRDPNEMHTREQPHTRIMQLSVNALRVDGPGFEHLV